jgi:F0F1-type ATP synthase delta subunit
MPQDPFLQPKDQLKPKDPFLKPKDPFKEQGEPSAGFGKNLFRTIGGAARDVAQATLDVGAGLEKALPMGGFSTQDNPTTEKVEGLRYVSPDELKLLNEYYGKLELPKVEEPTYPGGSFARDLTGFLAPVKQVSTIAAPIQAVTTGQKLAKGAAIGAVAEQFAFSPYEQRISNLIQEYPSLQNPVTEYLQADPNDSEATARFKMAIEGAAIGVPIDAVLRTFGKMKANKVAQEQPAKVETPVDDSSVIDTTTTVTQAKKETPPDFAGNINLKKIDAPDEVKNVIDDIAKNNDDFIDARRGVVKFGTDGEELAALAKETGLDEEQLLKRKTGEAFNAETAYAARVLNVNSAENLVELAKKARSTKATAEDLIEFNQALTRHASIQEQVAGITAEAGRALRSFKEIAASKGAIQERLIKEYIQGKGGKENIESIAEAISKLDDPEQIARFSKEVYKATKLDQVQEAWINALLSSPSTHAVNILSNTLVAASRIPEYGIATVLGSVRKGQDKVTFTELGARILGNIYGTLDGLRMGSKAIIDPDSVVDPLTKLELQKQNAIPGVAGEIVRLPGRALVAEDTFFKAIGYRQELFGQAVRKAKQEGKGVERVFELIKDPKKNFPDAYSKGQEIARYQTFTNPLGSTGQAFQKIIANNQYLRFLAPFVRTPVNIVKYAAQRTPLGIFAKTYKEGIKKGGAEADLVRARVILGTSIMSAIAYLSNEGLVTGRGPSDPGKRTVLRETGWQPYSLKIDDTYYGYNRFEPAGILFGLAADTVDIYNYADSGFIKSNEGEIDELVSMIVGSATQNITNKTFMTGITDAINVISDPDRYGEKWINRFASTVVPTGVYYLRKGEDPLVRDAVTMADSISNRIPGKSDELPFKRNVFGEPIEYSKNYSPEFLGKFGKTFSPIQTSKEKQDVVFDEMNRLDITPNRPHRKIGGVDLNPVQYQGMLGEMLNLKTKQKLEFLIQNPAYKNALDSEKIDLIKEIIRQDQSVAREQTQRKYPQILTDQMLKQIEELNQ